MSGPNTSSPKVRKLLYFPTSLPDETLLSRVSRCHLLSGERKDEITFLSLFGVAGTAVDFGTAAPPPLKTLADRLPGPSSMQLGALLAANTFVPLVMPIADCLDWHRPAARFATCNCCAQCLFEDEALVGVPYLRRAHQLPGVIVCGKHGTKLIDSCPGCSEHFDARGKFLAAPLIPCRCGWDARRGGPTIFGAAAEQGFAANAQTVLEQRTQRMLVSDLVKFFDLHIMPTKRGIRQEGVMFRNLLAERISQLLAEGHSAAEAALAAAKVIASTKEPNWWIATLNPKVLEERARRRQAVD